VTVPLAPIYGGLPGDLIKVKDFIWRGNWILSSSTRFCVAPHHTDLGVALTLSLALGDGPSEERQIVQENGAFVGRAWPRGASPFCRLTRFADGPDSRGA